MTKSCRSISLSLHQANLFTPQTYAVKQIVRPLTGGYRLLVVKKLSVRDTSKRNDPTIIELYTNRPHEPLILLNRIVDYDQVTFATWINLSSFLTVSKDQTISVYSSKTCTKTSSLITDYGPISCAKYFTDEKLLITGTELGIVAAYQLNNNKEFELVDKMVKVNTGIQSIDFKAEVRDKPLTKTVNPNRVVPGKRKRSDSSDDSSDEDETPDLVPFGHLDITIYGSTLDEIVTWNFHKKTIIETIKIGASSSVNVVLVLKNGDIAAGDSTGTVHFFDKVTFTEKKAFKVLNGEVVCMATDEPGERILVCGRDPRITLLKSDQASEDGNYELCETMENHSCHANAVEFIDTKGKEFLSGSEDGYIIKCKKHRDGRQTKTTYYHSYKDCIKFKSGEMLTRYERSLVIWKLAGPKSRESSKELAKDGIVERVDPVKHIELRTKMFIHASTASKNWICYSTAKEVYLFKRYEDKKLVQFNLGKKIPSCSFLELCSNDRYLVVASSRHMYLVDLEKLVQEKVVPGKPRKLKIISEYEFQGFIGQLIYAEKEETLIVASGVESDRISILKIIPSGKSFDFELVTRMRLLGYRYSFLAHSRPNLFMYTTDNKIIKWNLKNLIPGTTPKSQDVRETLEKGLVVNGLPNDTQIFGMVDLTDDYCLLYDKQTLYKLDMGSGKIIKTVPGYGLLVNMDNSVFSRADNVALVRLTPAHQKMMLRGSAAAVVNGKRKYGSN